MATGRALRWAACFGVTCLSGFAGAAGAQQPGGLRSVQQGVGDVEVAAANLQRNPLRQQDLRSTTYVEERLADGELFYRLKDYERAAIILTDVVVNYPDHRAAGDALYLLGESLFQANDYMGARTQFRRLVDRASEPGFSAHVPEALGRLIEIAVRSRDFDGVEEYFAQLERLPPREVEAATNYYRGKFLYNRAVATDDLLRAGMGTTDAHVDMAGLSEARQAFESVSDTSPYFLQARYFVGVILTLQQQYPAAAQAFQRVLDAFAPSSEGREVAELARLALGRVYYESQQLEEAVLAYQSVSRDSEVLDQALYEIAWVYIRMGDSTRAERALEVLMVAVPDSPYQADAQILRGNLLLREGRLPEAQDVFNGAIANYKPIREELDAIVAEHDDPVAYFRELVRQNIDSFDQASIVPPEALKYSREEVDIDRALRVLSDLNRTRSMVRETSDIIVRLSAALSGQHAVNVFPDLKLQRQRTLALRNRSAALRKELITREAAKIQGSDPELADLRRRRRELELAIGGMPTELEQFSERDEHMKTQFVALSKELCDLEVQIMGLTARIAATERFLHDTRGQRPENDEGIVAVLDELAAQKAAVAEYEEQVRQHRLALEAGEAQVGVGDDTYNRDQAAREEYNELVAQERALLASRGVQPDPAIDGLFLRLETVEQILQQRDQAIDAVVAERVARMRGVIDEETVHVEGYRTQLASLEDESEEVIGGVAYGTFARVRDRFYTLVLEADVGKIDVVWADREEHRLRVEQLSRDRAHEVKALEDEFREIMDQNGGGQ